MPLMQQLIGKGTLVMPLVSVLAACSDPADNDSHAETVIVAGGDQGRLAILEGPEGLLLAQPGPFPQFQDGYALSPDRETLYFTAVNTGTERVLLGIDTRSFTVTSQVTLAELESRSQVPGLTLVGNYSLVLSPDGSKLLLADAVREGTTGVAVLDVTSQMPIGFVGPLSVRPYGLKATPPIPGAPNGRIFAIGTRTPAGFPRADSLYILDALTLEIQNAAEVAPPAPDGLGNLFAIQPNPAGEMVYLLGADLLYAYDVKASAVVASAPAPRRGSIGVAPNGGTVYVTDPGDRREFPGSGLVLTFSPMLEAREAIDLRSESVDGVFPPTEGIAAGLDGTFLYIISGTGPRGPLFGPQARRVFIVDAGRRAVVGRVSLGDYGGGPIFTVR
jgi:DNA-binding beta-propeller fold protein YncE